MPKRRKFSAEFKAKVALEVLSGELSLAELASKYDVHATMIAGWNR
jgi:transposase